MPLISSKSIIWLQKSLKAYSLSMKSTMDFNRSLKMLRISKENVESHQFSNKYSNLSSKIRIFMNNLKI